jgi:hypothetical protein
LTTSASVCCAVVAKAPKVNMSLIHRKSGRSTLTLALILIGGLIAALVATLGDSIPPYGTDNVTVLVVVAMVLFWLGS